MGGKIFVSLTNNTKDVTSNVFIISISGATTYFYAIVVTFQKARGYHEVDGLITSRGFWSQTFFD
jgi:hypothetical protein